MANVSGQRSGKFDAASVCDEWDAPADAYAEGNGEALPAIRGHPDPEDAGRIP